MISKIFYMVLENVLFLNSRIHIAFLRKKGVTIGEGTEFHGRVSIDYTRPSLVDIGRNCVFTDGDNLLTHGYDWAVLRENYGEMLSSSGKVIIGDNVFIGVNVIILKGVRIGKNSIIGAGAVVNRDIPAGSVATGNPCRVVMTLDEYYQKRKGVYTEEAKAYALEIYLKTKKVPRQDYFWEEFPLFLPRDGDWGELPVKRQLGSAFNKFANSKPLYASFKEFLIDAGIPRNEVEKA